MRDAKKLEESSSKLPDKLWSSSLEAVYETAQHLSREEKAQLIRRLIDNSEMSLPLRVGITDSPELTVLNLSLDSREKIAQAIEIAASRLHQIGKDSNDGDRA